MAESVASLVERLDECVNDSEATAMNAVYVNVLLRDVLAYLKREAASRLSEQCIQTSDIGLSIDMLDADRLRHFAQNLLVYGPDITHWSSVPFVVSKLQTIATGIEKAVKDIGVLRLSSPEGTRGDTFRDWLIAEVADYRARAERAKGNVGVAGLSSFHAEYQAIRQKLVDVLAEYDRQTLSSPSSAPAATPAIDVNDRAIMSSYLDGCYCDVPEPVERILRQFFGSMLKPQASPRVSAATPAPDFDVQVGKALQDAMDATKDMRDRELAVESGPGPDLRPAQTWQPIEQFDKRSIDDALFWIVPKTREESYTDSSGNPILVSFKPYRHFGGYGSWPSVSKATHFCPVPPGPVAQEKDK